MESYTLNKTIANRKSILCVNCGNTFFPKRSSAKYCSSSCRSQHWMSSNNKKVLTLSVPEDIDEELINKIKELIENYTQNKRNLSRGEQTKRSFETFSVKDEKELRQKLESFGIFEYRIPQHNLGVYYDEKFSITKIPDGYMIKNF